MSTVFAYVLLLAFGAAYCLVACVPWLLSLLLPVRLRGRVMRVLIYGFGRTIVFGAMRPFARVRYDDRSDGSRDADVYVFNHRSGSDPFLMSALGRWNMVQFVNGWPMRLWFFGYYARLCEYVDVTRMSFEDQVRHVRGLVARGAAMIAFPEGHRSCSRRQGPFHSGIFRIARELGLSVCPCAIAGNEDIPDRAFRFRRRGRVVVRRLKTLSAEEVRAFGSPHALKRRVWEIISDEAEKMDRELDAHEI